MRYVIQRRKAPGLYRLGFNDPTYGSIDHPNLKVFEDLETAKESADLEAENVRVYPKALHEEGDNSPRYVIENVHDTKVYLLRVCSKTPVWGPYDHPQVYFFAHFADAAEHGNKGIIRLIHEGRIWQLS